MAFSTLATAQDANKESKKDGKRGYSVEQRLERMSTQLDLTDAQKPKVKAVLEETAEKMKDVPQDERREKGRAIMEEQNKKMKEILTEEQYKKYQELSPRGGKKGYGSEQKKNKKKTE